MKFFKKSKTDWCDVVSSMFFDEKNKYKNREVKDEWILKREKNKIVVCDLKSKIHACEKCIKFLENVCVDKSDKEKLDVRINDFKRYLKVCNNDLLMLNQNILN